MHYLSISQFDNVTSLTVHCCLAMALQCPCAVFHETGHVTIQLSLCNLILQMISAQVLNVFLACFWNNFQSWLPPRQVLQTPSKQLGLTDKKGVGAQLSDWLCLEHTGLFSDCGFLHANVNFLHKSLFSPAISTCMELPRHAQWKQVYKHAFPVHPMPQAAFTHTDSGGQNRACSGC